MPLCFYHRTAPARASLGIAFAGPIPDSELTMSFVRASGPGGQNANKVSTAIQRRFDIGQCPSLPDEVRQRLRTLAGNRVTRDGVLIMMAREHRTQEANRAGARARPDELIVRA